jgi:uncharacterized protein
MPKVSDPQKTVLSRIPAAKVKNIAMRTSEQTFALTLCLAFVLGCSNASAFEVKGAGADSAPALALPVLPPITAPAALPDLGVDKGLKDAWSGFVRSYKSGDKQAALKQLEIASEQGDILAQWKLGRMFADGDGVTRDDFKAFKLFSRIADARADESRDSVHAGVVSNAFVALGLYWSNGIPQSPVKVNHSHAMKAFNYAATYYGHPEAQYQLARMLLDGSTGKSEPKLALRWLNLAAEKGHGQAQAILGRMLFMGESTQRQTWKGLMWLQVAREQANGVKDGWVLDLHQKAYAAASEDERRVAQTHADKFLKAAERR